VRCGTGVTDCGHLYPACSNVSTRSDAVPVNFARHNRGLGFDDLRGGLTTSIDAEVDAVIALAASLSFSDPPSLTIDFRGLPAFRWASTRLVDGQSCWTLAYYHPAWMAAHGYASWPA